MKRLKEARPAKRRHPLAGVVGLCWVVLTLCAPMAVRAETCCKCASPTAPGKTICVATAASDCATAIDATRNPALSGTTCDPIGPPGSGQCRSIAQGGSCEFGPGPAESINLGTTAVGSGSIPIPIPVKLNVQIPGLTLSTTAQSEGGQLLIPFLAEYVAAVYKYGLGIAVIAAAVMIVYGGFLYIIGSTFTSISKGKDIIRDAIIGLLLLLGSYTILGTLNKPLVQPVPLGIQQVLTDDFKQIESSGIGYKDSAAAAQNQIAQAQAKILGTGPLINPEGGDPVSIDGIKEIGDKLSQRLQAYCTKPEDIAGLDTTEKKQAALARAILGFQKICIQENGCAYIRGGWTELSTGTVHAGALDLPFVLPLLGQFKYGHVNADAAAAIIWKDMPQCLSAWRGLTLFGVSVPGSTAVKDQFYDCRQTEECSAFDYNGGGKDSKGISIKGECYAPVFQAYEDGIAKGATESGLFGGDCGTTLATIYRCAGGTVARPQAGGPSSINTYLNGSLGEAAVGGKLEGDDIVAWNVASLEQLDAAIKAKGGMKFGDIITMDNGTGGAKAAVHNFMFTGGRDDVPFEIFEMGGGGGSDGVTGAQVYIRGWGTVGGMAAHPKDPSGRGILYDYLNARAMKEGKFPRVWITRPYQYRTCDNRAQCDEGELCLCRATEAKSCIPQLKCAAGKPRTGANCTREFSASCYQSLLGSIDCSMSHICRKAVIKPKFGLFCRDDEQCPNGTTCDIKTAQCK